MSKKVYIDPGHGGSDSGAVGIDNLLEKDVNLSVAKKLYNLLKKQNIEAKLSREEDKTLSLGQRTTEANNWGADVFVSIHCNAFNGSASGVETFSFSSLSADLAKDIQDSILKTGEYTKNRGIKTARFYVLRHTKMRAALVELGFVDHREDAKILRAKQDELAEAIARGICEYLGVKYTEPKQEKPVPPVSDSDTFYRVVAGSFNNITLAQEQVEFLKDKGIDSFIAVYHRD